MGKLVSCSVTVFVVIVACLYVDDMLKLDMIVCCRICFDLLVSCISFLMCGFCLLFDSAAFKRAAIMVGFRSGAHMI